MGQREASGLIPYFVKDGQFHFFLQKRTSDAPRHPGRIGSFGGGLEENETKEDAVRREIKEELGLDLEGEAFFKTLPLNQGLAHIFIKEVDEDFASTVTVMEGDWGRFFSEEEVRNQEEILDWVRDVVLDIADSKRGI